MPILTPFGTLTFMPIVVPGGTQGSSGLNFGNFNYGKFQIELGSALNGAYTLFTDPGQAWNNFKANNPGFTSALNGAYTLFTDPGQAWNNLKINVFGITPNNNESNVLINTGGDKTGIPTGTPGYPGKVDSSIPTGTPGYPGNVDSGIPTGTPGYTGGVDTSLTGNGVIMSTRPTWRDSENDVGNDLGAGYNAQESYLNGQLVPSGTPGSVRPDFVATDGTASFEVKNYNIQTNSNGLINNVSNQVIQRATNLPAGMDQQIIIDVRGQTITPAQENAIINGIVQKSGGAISPTSITFKK